MRKRKKKNSKNIFLEKVFLEFKYFLYTGTSNNGDLDTTVTSRFSTSKERTLKIDV